MKIELSMISKLDAYFMNIVSNYIDKVDTVATILVIGGMMACIIPIIIIRLLGNNFIISIITNLIWLGCTAAIIAGPIILFYGYQNNINKIKKQLKKNPTFLND